MAKLGPLGKQPTGLNEQEIIESASVNQHINDLIEQHSSDTYIVTDADNALTGDGGIYKISSVQYAEESGTVNIDSPDISVVQAGVITDAGNYFTSDTIEGALQEIGAAIGDISSMLDNINGEVI